MLPKKGLAEHQQRQQKGSKTAQKCSKQRSKNAAKKQQKAANSSNKQQKRSKTAQKTAEKATNIMKNQQKAQDSPEAGTKNSRKKKTFLNALSSLSGPRCGCMALAKRALKSHRNATKNNRTAEKHLQRSALPVLWQSVFFFRPILARDSRSKMIKKGPPKRQQKGTQDSHARTDPKKQPKGSKNAAKQHRNAAKTQQKASNNAAKGIKQQQKTANTQQNST